MRRSFVLAAGLVVLLVGGVSAVVPVFPAGGLAESGSSASGGLFTSLTPARVLDTRTAVGVPTKTPVAAGATVNLPIRGHGGVPASGVSAVVLNVTVTQPSRTGYITVWGDGMTRPETSNLNFIAGQTVPNLVIAPIGSDGDVDFYNRSNGTVHLVVDVSGYYTMGTATDPGAFTSLPPARVLDTRHAVGVSTTTPVAARATVILQVDGAGGVLASGVSAVVLNVTVTQPTRSGYLTALGDGSPLPTASNLNYLAGQTVPNLVIAPVGPDGAVDFYNGSSGTVHLVADVFGYFLTGKPTVPGAFGALSPARLLDTRIGEGATKQALGGGQSLTLQVDGRGGVPTSGVSAAVMNVTVTQPTAPGAITVYPGGTSLPLASNLNYVAGQTVPNLVIAPISADGKVVLHNASAGTVQLVADVSGYFAQFGPWTQTDPSMPDGGIPYSLSCPSASVCVAVGSGAVGGSGVPLVDTLAGSQWTPAVVTAPAGQVNANLSGVSCSSAQTCIAVGSESDYGGSNPTPLIEQLTGSGWAGSLLPRPPDTSGAELSAVSCSTSSTCAAVGLEYPTGSQAYEPLLETLSQGVWTATRVPVSAGSVGTMTGVSCTTATNCVAVGWIEAGQAGTPLVETLNGGTWTPSTPPTLPGDTYTNLNAVSCTAPTTCTAVGYDLNSGKPVAETLQGTTWTVTRLPGISGYFDVTPYSVSCSTASACTAVGGMAATSQHAAQFSLPLSETLSGGTWTPATLPLAAAYNFGGLSSISCSSPFTCIGVGSASEPQGSQPLIERR